MSILEQLANYIARQKAKTVQDIHDPKTLALVKNLAMNASMAGPTSVGKEAITTLAPSVNTIANVGGKSVVEIAKAMMEDTINRVLTRGYGEWPK